MAKRGRPLGSKNKQPRSSSAPSSPSASPSSSRIPSSSSTALPATASTSASVEGRGNHNHNHGQTNGEGGGVWMAVCVIALTFLPKALGMTLRRIGGVERREAFQTGGPTRRNSKNLFDRLTHTLNVIGSKLSIAGVLGTMVVAASLAPTGTFQLYHTTGEIPAIAFRTQTTLSAQVVRVTDGDTVRVRHTPLFPIIDSSSQLHVILARGADSGRLTEETLVVRLAGVDAPETAKANGPGQPYANEAKQFVKDKVLNNQVRVKLLRRDQYARAVATIRYGPMFMQKDLGDELLKEGLAVIYRQKGAEYDGRFKEMERYENQARFKRKGIWSQVKGSKEAETPAQYKARQRKLDADRILAPTGG